MSGFLCKCMLIYAHKAVAVPEAALIGSCRSVCAEEGTFGSWCLCKVRSGCLSVVYMLWIDCLHESVAHPLHRTRCAHQQMGLCSKKTLHTPRAQISQLQFLHGCKQPGHHYKINAPASSYLASCTCLCVA